MTHTPAYHIIDGKRIIMPAHSITLYPPYSSMEYGSLENEIFCDDWLRFYTDEPFICNSSVPLGTPFKSNGSLLYKQPYSLNCCGKFFSKPI